MKYYRIDEFLDNNIVMSDRIRARGVAALALVLVVMVLPVYSAPMGPGARAAKRYAAKASPGARRGRPRKFDVPSRAVTLTLPEDVIAALQAVDRDLSRAVVRAALPLAAERPRALAELATYDDRAVIVVPRNRELKARTGAELVPLSDGRALILLDDRLSIPQFELQLMDALADPGLKDGDRALFGEVAEILRSSRRTEGIELRERSIIVMRRTKPRAGPAERRPQDARTAR
jgi:hypothetical protein